MEQLCQNLYCKGKLKEYRDLTRKLYDDIDGLEDDIRDKDTYTQKVVKARNANESEVALLKKKHSALIKENCDLLEQVKQLDEDTDAGVEMLQMAHERERKFKKEVDEYKENVKKQLEGTEKEKADFEAKFRFLKDKLEKSLKQNQELLAAKDSKIKELEEEILLEKENSEKNKDKHEHSKSDDSKLLKEQQVVLEALKVENCLIKQKHDDIMDELEVKRNEVIALENQAERESLKSSGSSFGEELEQLQIFQCNSCNLNFENKGKLEKHKSSKHEERSDVKIKLLIKLNSLEKKLSDQKQNLTTSLLKLKKKEVKESQKCRCKRLHLHCRIFHQKHNFLKSKSEELFLKMKNINKDVVILVESEKVKINSDVFGGAREKSYSCKLCDKRFSKQGDLKRHKKRDHKWNQTF